jgi:hypothetical protein
MNRNSVIVVETRGDWTMATALTMLTAEGVVRQIAYR